MNVLLADSPALARLRWLLDGLDGRWPADTDRRCRRKDREDDRDR